MASNKRAHLVMKPGEVHGVWRTLDEMTDAEVIEYGARALDFASDVIRSGALRAGALPSTFHKDVDLIARLTSIAQALERVPKSDRLVSAKDIISSAKDSIS